MSDHRLLGVSTVVLDLCAATLEHLKLLSARHSYFLDGVSLLLFSDNFLLRLLYLQLQRRDHFVFSFLTVLQKAQKCSEVLTVKLSDLFRFLEFLVRRILCANGFILASGLLVNLRQLVLHALSVRLQDSQRLIDLGELGFLELYLLC